RAPCAMALSSSAPSPTAATGSSATSPTVTSPSSRTVPHFQSVRTSPYRRRPGGELGGRRAPSFPAPRRQPHRRLGRSERLALIGPLRRLMMETPPPVGRLAHTPALDPRRWWALALLCGAFFMVLLDGTISIVALPSIGADLGFSKQGLPWVLSAYALTFGGLLLLGGRAADLLGRRRVFMAGVVVFTAASL